jgi:hypothetical protein
LPHSIVRCLAAATLWTASEPIYRHQHIHGDKLRQEVNKKVAISMLATENSEVISYIFQYVTQAPFKPPDGSSIAFCHSRHVTWRPRVIQGGIANGLAPHAALTVQKLNLTLLNWAWGGQPVRGTEYTPVLKEAA